MNYKQQSSQGCLVVDLMYLFDVGPSREKEQELLVDGLFRRDNFVIGCLQAFLDRHPDASAKVYVDNAFFHNVLRERVNHPRITMAHKKNNDDLLNSLDAPFVVYVDNNITDGWTHLPHFMLVTKKTDKFYDVFDPWVGKTSKISKGKLMTGIDLLRSHVKVCPIVIAKE